MNRELIAEKAGVKLYMMQDPDAESPREDCENFGTMVCWHKRYNLGEDHDFKTPQDFLEWWKENGEGGEMLALGLYDHSGITMYCGNGPHWQDSAGWDSGQVGWIYVTAKQIRDNWSCKRINKKTRAHGVENLRGEVEAYDQFLTGDVWGYEIEDEDGEHLDSCWGFFGHDYAKGEAMEQFEYYVKKAEAVEAHTESAEHTDNLTP